MVGPKGPTGCSGSYTHRRPWWLAAELLRSLGAHLYVCGPSMEHYKVRSSDLAFDGVIVAEYLTFMEVMGNADVHVYV